VSALINIVNQPPQVQGPENFDLEIGTSTSINWTIMDWTCNQTTSYTISNNSVPFASGPWTTGENISISISGPSAGIYIYSISVDDGFGGVNESDVTVTVMDTVPSISGVASLSFPYNTSGAQVQWQIADPSVMNPYLCIYRNDTMVILNQIWAPDTPITLLLDGLLPGAYNLTIIATDGYGQNSSYITWVNITLGALDITHPRDIAYEFGTEGVLLSWTITDSVVRFPNYTIYQNDNPIAIKIPWISGTPVMYSLESLTIGQWNFTINATDDLGQNVTDEVWVNVFNVNPSITHPIDFSFVTGTTGNVINWTITDKSTGQSSFTLFRNGTPVVTNQVWHSGAMISISLDDLPVGSYNFTIVANDGLGGVNAETVIVTIVNPSSIPPQNPPDSVFLILIIILIIVGVGGTIFLVLRRRKGSKTRDDQDNDRAGMEFINDVLS